jgi:hypothetical protein
VIDKTLGMIPAFKQGLLKQLKPPRVSFQRFPLLVIKFLQPQPKLPIASTAENKEHPEEIQKEDLDRNRKNLGPSFNIPSPHFSMLSTAKNNYRVHSLPLKPPLRWVARR